MFCTAPLLRKDVGGKTFLETLLKMYFENLPNAESAQFLQISVLKTWLCMREVYKEKEKELEQRRILKCCLLENTVTYRYIFHFLLIL